MADPGEVDAPAPSTAPAPLGADWATQAVDLLDSVVDGIRSKTTEPITKAARALVYGIVLGVMGSVALIIVAIAFVRVLDILIPGAVWSAHLAVGVVFVAAGLFIWTRRSPRKK